jgi:hypothetical protein
MAQLIVSMNLSLDGYIEAQGQDDGSWLRIDEAVHRGVPFFRPRLDLKLVGVRRFDTGVLALRYSTR